MWLLSMNGVLLKVCEQGLALPAVQHDGLLSAQVIMCLFMHFAAVVCTRTVVVQD
jgi:hypothetical protein